ncbi:hypothetical protein [Stenomitos frigidus]|uniref:hypothetical protein n=1 Tax=Stenomitos frigidus TaxID=1886765 RepID=UPI0015E6FCFE|nr:hypothetical protein [Stenomitos frigidus]
MGGVKPDNVTYSGFQISKPQALGVGCRVWLIHMKTAVTNVDRLNPFTEQQSLYVGVGN